MKKRDLIEALKPLADDTEIVIDNAVTGTQIEYIRLQRRREGWVHSSLPSEDPGHRSAAAVSRVTVPSRRPS